MPFVALDNINLHWRQNGDPLGKPMVLVNSLGTDLRMWDDLLPHLPSDARVIRYDLRGQGRAQSPPPPFSLDDLSDDLAKLLDQLNITGCTLVGTSLGGMIAQSLAVMRPDLVRCLVLTNTAPKMGSAEMWETRINAVRTRGLAGAADDILDRWFGPCFRTSKKADFWRQALTNADPEGYVGACQAIAQAALTPCLSKISQRTLVIGCVFDQASPPEQVRDMAQKIRNGTYHVLLDVGHQPSIEAPEALAMQITALMNEVVHA